MARNIISTHAAKKNDYCKKSDMKFILFVTETCVLSKVNSPTVGRLIDSVNIYHVQ